MAHFGWIWAILLGFGPYSLDLGPKGDEALKMGQRGTYGRTDGQIPPVFYRTSSPSGALPKRASEKATVNLVTKPGRKLKDNEKRHDL